MASKTRKKPLPVTRALPGKKSKVVAGKDILKTIVEKVAQEDINVEQKADFIPATPIQFESLLDQSLANKVVSIPVLDSLVRKAKVGYILAIEPDLPVFKRLYYAVDMAFDFFKGITLKVISKLDDACEYLISKLKFW